MILVGQYDSPFVRRVAVSLHHYHMPFTRKPLSVFGDKKEVQAINPLLRVPILILENGETLIDSNAILDHLDHVVGNARALTPPNGPERRKVLQICAVSTGISDKVDDGLRRLRGDQGRQASSRRQNSLLSRRHPSAAEQSRDEGRREVDGRAGLAGGHHQIRQ